jgi:kelch repeat and BTB domain-containing protein 12
MIRPLLLLTTCSALSAADLTPLPVAITSFGAVISESQLYVYGGHKSGSHEWSKETTSGELHRLDLNNPANWETLAGGPAVQSPGLAVHKGSIYLVGGMQPQNATSKEQPILKSLTHAAVFSPKTGEWKKLPELPEPRSSHDIAVLDGKLYVVGGWPLDTASSTIAPDDRTAERPFHTTMLVLDLAKPEKWELIEQPFKRRAVALVSASGKLFCLGGMTSKNEVSAAATVFDPVTKTWSDLPDLPVAGKMKAFATAACELDGRVIASPSGGKVFALSTDSKTWKEVGQLQQSRFFHQLESWKDHQIIALGGTKGGEPLDNVELLKVAPPAEVTVK